MSGNCLVSIGSGDDSIDFADGWTGTGSNWYIKGEVLKAGIEGSNNGGRWQRHPVTTTTLSNITVVGPVTEVRYSLKRRRRKLYHHQFLHQQRRLGCEKLLQPMLLLLLVLKPMHFPSIHAIRQSCSRFHDFRLWGRQSGFCSKAPHQERVTVLLRS